MRSNAPYLALARKWRPRSFTQLVGQEHVTQILINSLQQQRVHHAYLFTGTRGVGKTSVARLLAKALNCRGIAGINVEPCLQCEICLAIEQGCFIDLIEIDAASKTRVEDTRELLENVQYVPVQGKYKIYLIDEVHMLSTHSFNALLKTLEEPPEHVKFLLATTDPQKIPETVLSRCLQFNLKHLANEVIVSYLQKILRVEHYEFEEAALQLLARAAAGSMRDALSLLDQAIACSDDKISVVAVKILLGYTQQDYAFLLLESLLTANAALLIKLSRQIASDGGNFSYVLDELLQLLHQIMVLQMMSEHNDFKDDAVKYQQFIHGFSIREINVLYQIGLKAVTDMHYAPTLAIGFEMTLLRMLANTAKGGEKINITAGASSNLVNVRENDVEEAPSAVRTVTLDEKNIAVAEEATSSLSNDLLNKNTWPQIIAKLDLSPLELNVAQGMVLMQKNAKEVVMNIPNSYKAFFGSNKIIKNLEQKLSDYCQENITIVLNFIATELTVQSPIDSLQKEVLKTDKVFQNLQKILVHKND